MKNIRLIVYLIAASFFLFSCGNKNKEGAASVSKTAKEVNDLKKEKLNGKVKTVRQKVYWSLEKFGRVEKGKIQNLKDGNYLKTYNKAGMLTEEIYYDVNDKEIRRNAYTYADDKLQKAESFTEGQLSQVVNCTYENGRLNQKETKDDKGNLKERYDYTYYENGLLMDEDKTGSNNQLIQKIVHIYDIQNRLKEKQYYWGGGSPFKREKFEYDDNGNISAILTDKYENKVPVYAGKVEFSDYGAFGDYKKETLYDKENEKIEIREYTYDAHGNLIESSSQKLKKQVVSVSAEPVETVDASSDDESAEDAIMEDFHGSAINTEEIVDWISDGGAVNEYQYDKENNWTVKITYKIEQGAKTRQFYYERVIEYQ